MSLVNNPPLEEALKFLQEESKRSLGYFFGFQVLALPVHFVMFLVMTSLFIQPISATKVLVLSFIFILYALFFLLGFIFIRKYRLTEKIEMLLSQDIENIDIETILHTTQAIYKLLSGKRYLFSVMTGTQM
jgi:hypothetical protein